MMKYTGAKIKQLDAYLSKILSEFTQFYRVIDVKLFSYNIKKKKRDNVSDGLSFKLVVIVVILVAVFGIVAGVVAGSLGMVCWYMLCFLVY